MKFLFAYLFVVVVFDRVSLCSSGYPGKLSVDQALGPGPKLTEILLPLSPKVCTTMPDSWIQILDWVRYDITA